MSSQCNISSQAFPKLVVGFSHFTTLPAQVLAGSAEFRALNKPDKDRQGEAKEVAKLYRNLYRVSLGQRWPLVFLKSATRASFVVGLC